VAGDDPGELSSLRDWLGGEHPVRAYGDLRWGTPEAPGHQGVLVDVLTLVVGAGLSTAQLILAVAEWRRSRPRQPVVTITRELRDGTVVRVDTYDPQALAEAVRRLEEK